jgi:hypothetical protein
MAAPVYFPSLVGKREGRLPPLFRRDKQSMLLVRYSGVMVEIFRSAPAFSSFHIYRFEGPARTQTLRSAKKTGPILKQFIVSNHRLSVDDLCKMFAAQELEYVRRNAGNWAILWFRP